MNTSQEQGSQQTLRLLPNRNGGGGGGGGGEHQSVAVPSTSVVNKRCRCCARIGCRAIRFTAAQWIWWLNLVCLLAHTTMVVVVLWSSYWRWGRSIHDADHVTVQLYRLSVFPTKEMVEADPDAWKPERGWNLTGSSSMNYNLRPAATINYATLTLSFFACSAVAHAWAVIAGAPAVLSVRWHRGWMVYWRQLDDAFSWWRWLEYSASAGLMAIAIAIALGIREQSVLVGIFVLHWSTMAFGFLVEYTSTPMAHRTTTARTAPSTFTFRVRSGTATTDASTKHSRRPRALKTIDQWHWAHDRPTRRLRGGAKGEGEGNEDHYLEEARMQPRPSAKCQRTKNYLRRMAPHAMGIVTLAAAWAIMIEHLEWTKSDLKDIWSDASMPEFVNGLLYGSVLIFWSFGVVQVIFQCLPPGYYWGTEICYCVLSLTAKLYLGFILLLNVLVADGSR